MAELESLAADEALDRHVERHRLDRLLMLTDGVFAIAITLSALEIHVPSPFPGLAAALHAMRRDLVTYGVGFVVIAVFWISNRELFARVRRVDAGMTGLVLALLCVSAVIPAASRMSTVGDSEAVGSLRFYALTMLIAGTLNCATWVYAALRPGVMRIEVTRGYRWQRILMAATMPALFAIVLAAPDQSVFTWLIPATALVVVVRRGILPRLFADR